MNSKHPRSAGGILRCVRGPDHGLFATELETPVRSSHPLARHTGAWTRYLTQGRESVRFRRRPFSEAPPTQPNIGPVVIPPGLDLEGTSF